MYFLFPTIQHSDIHNIICKYKYKRDFFMEVIGKYMIVFLSKEEAINQSLQYPNHRVEIFSKTNTTGYRPTYNYYQNGEYIQTS